MSVPAATPQPEYGPQNFPGSLPSTHHVVDSRNASATEQDDEVQIIDHRLHHQERPSSSSEASTSTTPTATNVLQLAQQLRDRRRRLQLARGTHTADSSRRNSLVPSGFECVAHPIFFQAEFLNRDADVESSVSRSGPCPSSRRRSVSGRPPQSRERFPATINTTSAGTSRRGGGNYAIATSSTRRRGNVSNGLHAVGPRQSQQEFVTGSRLVKGELSFAEDGYDDSKKTDGNGTSRGGRAEVGKRRGAQPSEGGREIDKVCPICLGRFEQPVTLTSCLHSFCHTCILGWYEHTVAVALARGGVAALQNPTGSTRIGGVNGRISHNDGTIPAPYRCPLCQVPGPYFLTVEAEVPAATPIDSAAASGVHQTSTNSLKLRAGKLSQPRLKFKLLGARTILGGNAREPGGGNSSQIDVSGRSNVGAVSSSDGDATHARGYPSMTELRAAVRTQLALAAVVSAADKAEETNDANGTTAGDTDRDSEGAGGGKNGMKSPESREYTKARRRKRDRWDKEFDDRDGVSPRPRKNRSDRRDEMSDHRGMTKAKRSRRSRSFPGSHRNNEGDNTTRDWTSIDACSASISSRKHGTASEIESRGPVIRREVFGDCRGRESRSDDDGESNGGSGLWGRKRRSSRTQDELDKGKANRRSRRRGENCLALSVDEPSGGLPWNPGSMPAEAALEAVESMLEEEREKLRQR